MYMYVTMMIVTATNNAINKSRTPPMINDVCSTLDNPGSSVGSFSTPNLLSVSLFSLIILIYLLSFDSPSMMHCSTRTTP